MRHLSADMPCGMSRTEIRSAPLSIAIVGAGNLDVCAGPVDRDLFDKHTDPVQSITLSFGGDALNEACVIAALGLPVCWVGLVKDDLAGQVIQDFCARQKIAIQKVNTQAPTGINVVLIEEDAERCFITCPATSMRKLSLANVPAIQADIVCLASLFVSYDLPLADAAVLMQRWKKEGKITAMDTTTAKHQESLQDLKAILPWVDYFFTNLEEAASITHTWDPRENLRLFASAGAKTVLLKAGRQGVWVLHQDRMYRSTAAPNPDCIDTTGCGVSFAGGFLAALACGRDFETCLHQAKACGSLASSAVGATEAFRQLSAQELQKQLEILIEASKKASEQGRDQE